MTTKDNDDRAFAGGDLCPRCHARSDCKHFVTSYDMTYAWAYGRGTSPIEPEEPLGYGPVELLADAITVLLQHLLEHGVEKTRGAVALATGFPERLAELFWREYERTDLYEYEGRMKIDRDVKLAAWIDYLRSAIEESDQHITRTAYMKATSMTCSQYSVHWAKNGPSCADDAIAEIGEDTNRVHAALREAGVESEGS